MRCLGGKIWGGLLLLLAPTAVLGQSPAEWTAPFEPIQIADNLFYVGSAGLSAFLLTSTDGHILIDAPMAENVPLVVQNIRTLGFDPRDIRLHVVTHAHYDHVAGLAGLMEETGGDLLVSEADAAFVIAGRDFGFETSGFPPAAVTRTLEHLKAVRLGDLELVPHITPGHTPGCTSWSGTVTIEGEPHSFALICSLSALDVYRLGGSDPTYAGQASDFCRSVEHLRTLDPDIFLANHSQFFALASKAEARKKGDTRAFVDRAEHGRFMENAAAAIDRTLASQGLQGCVVAPQPSIVLPEPLDRVLRDYERYWQAGDAHGLASLFVDNGLIVRNGTWIRGRKSIQAAYRNASGDLRLRAVEAAADDELGYIIGAYGYGDDVPIQDRGMFVLTLKRSPDGGWLIVSDLDRGISE